MYIFVQKIRNRLLQQMFDYMVCVLSSLNKANIFVQTTVLLHVFSKDDNDFQRQVK